MPRSTLSSSEVVVHDGVEAPGGRPIKQPIEVRELMGARTSEE
jgi:hypothetical protein